MRLLREALALWRGPAFADLPEVGPLAAAVAGFEQLRRELTDLLIRSAIDAGMAEGVVGLAATRWLPTRCANPRSCC